MTLLPFATKTVLCSSLCHRRDVEVFSVVGSVWPGRIVCVYCHLAVVSILLHPKKYGFLRSIFCVNAAPHPPARPRKGEEVPPPKCKSQKSRVMAFKLLAELARGCPSNADLVS